MGIGKRIDTFTIDNVEGGCNYLSDITEVQPNQSPNAMNMEFRNGRWMKRRGVQVLASLGSTATTYSLVDFGVVSSVHKQVAHFGDTVYYLNDSAGDFTAIRTSAPEARSYNSKVGSYLIQTYENYSTPYYWDGSAANMSIVSASVPAFKRCIEFQGFLMGFNTSSAKMRVYYEATTTMIGGSYADFFPLTPAPNDDEVTEPFLLNGRLYAGSKYSVFRISYVGGVTVFEYKQVISDTGIVPNTLQVVITKDYGQVAIFMGYDRRMYMFDGANIKTISDLYYKHTDDTDISMDLIDDQYLANTFSVFDTKARVYRLITTRLGRTSNYYGINIDVDTFAYYPYDNMVYSCGAMCYDSIGRKFLVFGGYDGKLHKAFTMVNSDEGRVIREYYESPLLSKKHSAIKQGQNITLLLRPGSHSNVALYEKVDFARGWKKRLDVPLAHSRDRFLGENAGLGNTAVLGFEYDLLRSQVNLPTVFNTYQFKLTTDADQDNYPLCSYETGTVSGSAGGVVVTLSTAGTWTSAMTADAGYRIWIKDGGLNQMTSQAFTFITSSTATVTALESSAFSDVAYEVYRTGCDACAQGWELLKVEFNDSALTVGRSEPQR